MKYPRTVASAWAENAGHPYERREWTPEPVARQPEPGLRVRRPTPEPSGLLLLFPAAGFAFGCLMVALFLA